MTLTELVTSLDKLAAPPLTAARFSKFQIALVNAWPQLSAGIRDLAAQVEDLKLLCFAHDEGARLNKVFTAELVAERDALAARLVAAEKVCRAVDEIVLDIALDAWREAGN